MMANPRLVRLATLALLFATTPAFSSGWTEQTVPGSSGVLFVVDAVNENVVWAAGDNRQVFRTTDGGAHWELRATPSGSHSALWAFDADRCVVAGSSGVFWRTTDGGLTWTDVHHAGSFIDGIHFFDDLNGWAIGDPVAGQWVIRKTTDGGVTWSPAPAPPTAQGGGITRSLGWIGTQIGAFGTNRNLIWRTTDGGQGWSSVATATQQVAGLVLGTGGIGLIGGDLDLLERSTDSGASWQVVPSPTGHRLLTFDWIDGTAEVWGSTSQGGLFHSTDGGFTWEQNILGAGYIAEDLDFADPDVGWSVGQAGRIWRYSATTGVDASAAGAVTRLQVSSAPNPFANAVTFTGRVDGPAQLRIYDVLGREVATLAHPASAGDFALRWDGRDRGGQPVGAGAYFWRLETPGARTQGKLVRSAP
jgi:photosystem II stability/assembly factor-like uncharacterized protein